jgi:hypothetical protein
VTAPHPSPEVCHFAGLPSNARIITLDDGGWQHTCNCLTVTYRGPSYDAMMAAIQAHLDQYPLPTPPAP